MLARDNARFVRQAADDYTGTPTRIARFFDALGEEHVVIESVLSDGRCVYYDWIGAENADQPDEWGMDRPPHHKMKFHRIPADMVRPA